jgi:hypothetical protein
MLEEEVSEKSRDTTLIIAIFGGLWGFHHWYLGNKGKMLFYIFSAGGLFIMWIWDVYLIAIGRMYDSEGKRIMTKNQIKFYNSHNTIYKEKN